MKHVDHGTIFGRSGRKEHLEIKSMCSSEQRPPRHYVCDTGWLDPCVCGAP